MIEVTRGQMSNHIISEKLVDMVKKIDDVEGKLFLGYPILPTMDNKISIDALLVSPQSGVLAIVFYNGVKEEDFEDIHDEIHGALLSKFAKEKALVKRGNIQIDLDVITYAPNLESDTNVLCNIFKNENCLMNILNSKNNSNNRTSFEYAMRNIQSIGSMKKVLSREKVTKENSRGWKLKELEKHVANLDQTQMSAALETSDNVQRIRGLAGSGKTIVLALKAAYLHVANPNWKIAVTFNTRSLKQQFIELVTRFVYEQSESTPNWENINIIHAWGSTNEEGVYYNFCKSHEVDYLDFKSAKNSTTIDPFAYACGKALNSASKINNMYDAIFIDEAQDFSNEFLSMCYQILPEKKRLVYAYDELQSLTANSMDAPEVIFGSSQKDVPNVVLKNEVNCAREDIILEVCYRNSRPILSSAHALGFRIYGEILQMFDDASLWSDIGYTVESGQLEDDQEVVLKRTSQSSPEFLEKHSDVDDLVVFKQLNSDIEQAEWIANEIRKNLNEDELEFKDILVIHTNPLTTKSSVGMIRNALARYKINSHLAGVNTSPDKFFMERSITFTSIFRAKGNEAAMVYVFDGQNCGGVKSTARSRNILFTAMTRSKAWLRVVGYGDNMKSLCDEFNIVKSNDFKLSFNYPNKKLRERLNIIHRDKSKHEQNKINRSINEISKLLEEIENGSMFKEDIPEELRKKLLGIISDE